MPISSVSSAYVSSTLPPTYWSVTASATSRVGGAERAASATLSQADQRPAADSSNDNSNNDARVASSSTTAAEDSTGSRRATERASDAAPDQGAQADATSRESDTEKNADNPFGNTPTRPDGTPLNEQEIRQVEQLKQTDQEVRQHERAHEIAGGPYTGSASYDYQSGPDGKRYAVAGEVPIDYGPVKGNPQATVEKMQTVIAAAMAPAEPSSKDLQVAAQARQYLLEAKLEASRLQSEMNNARSAGSVSNEPTTDMADASTAAPDNTPPRAA